MIHLHAHSSFSQLDGVGSPDQYARKAAQLGHGALALTEHGNLNSALAHRRACREVGIVPIGAIETYYRPNRLTREKEMRYQKWHVVLLAKNLRGWKNLVKLSSRAYADGLYQFPCIDPPLLREYREGLICTTSCVLGPLPYVIEHGNDAEAKATLEMFLSIFGDDLFFAISPHDFDRQREINLAITSLARERGQPLLYEGDAHYPELGWEETQKIAVLIGMSKTVDTWEKEAKKREEEGQDPYELWHEGLHLMDEVEVRQRFAEHHPNLPQDAVDEAIKNTDLIASQIEPFLLDRTVKMPRVGGDARSEIMRWCREGMKRIGKDGDEIYENQLRYEAEVIDGQRAWEMLHFVADAVRWARSEDPLPATEDDPFPDRKRPIRLNTRGSAAASLVCYLSRISTLDPIAHKFKFERFINPERKSIPDIDLDVASSGRQMLKEYVARKYGRGSVADIVAYQHFQPRAALKNVATTLYGFDSDAYREIARLVHEETGVIDAVHDIDLEALREREPELDAWATRFPVGWEHARRLENAGDPSVLRLSKHAAGVAVLPGDVSDYMPTIRASDEEVGTRTAWAETSRISVTEEVGIVKADFLGLKGMDQQQMIVDRIAERTGEVIDLDDLPPLRDPHDVEDGVMDIFRAGLTLGVNQFAGHGVRNFLERAAPDDVVDLTAINAIYRPGPLGSGSHNRYVKRKRGSGDYEIPDVLHDVLDDTYGILVFQESVMEVFQVLVGYSAGQADDVRKEIDKLNRSKNQEGRQKLAKRREEFVAAGAEVLGSQELAEQIWQEILPFTGYAFARPHSGSYAGQAYQDGWLKKHYPLDSYAVMLTMEGDRTADFLREAREFGISVMPPDVNISGDSFTADHEAGAIRYGLRGIKGIGDAAISQVMALRPFSSLYDFDHRNSQKYSKCNKGHREALESVGALDSLGGRKGWSESLKAAAEGELLGVSLRPGGTFGPHEPLVMEHAHSEEEYRELPDGAIAVVAGRATKIHHTRTKRGKSPGQEMAFVDLTFGLDKHFCTLFPPVYAAYRHLLHENAPLLVRGKKTDRGLTADGVMGVEEFVRQVNGVAA